MRLLRYNGNGKINSVHSYLEINQLLIGKGSLEMLKFSDMRETDKFLLFCILSCILIEVLIKNWSAVLAWTACACWMLDGLDKDLTMKNTIKSLDELKQIVKGKKFIF